MNVCRIIAGLLLLAVAAFPAHAGKVLRQNADGTASWVSTSEDTASPAGEHHFTVTISDLGTASTSYIMVPFSGRLRSASVMTEGTITSASETIEFYIASPTTTGGIFGQFTPVTPLVGEAATGQYELVIGLSYAATGQISTVSFLGWPSTSLNLPVSDRNIIAIHNLGTTTAEGSNEAGYVTIVVH